jgi:hypothetical protein
MENRPVLNVGSRADGDSVRVAAEDGVEPDTRPSPHDDVADDLGAVGHIGGVIDLGMAITE